MICLTSGPGRKRTMLATHCARSPSGVEPFGQSSRKQRHGQKAYGRLIKSGEKQRYQRASRETHLTPAQSEAQVPPSEVVPCHELAGLGHRSRAMYNPAIADKSWATMKDGASDGRMPENVSVSDRAKVTAGLANKVDAVNQYALVM